VLHYNVVRNNGGDVSIEGDTRSFLCLDEIVEYFRCSRGGLATRLRRALSEATLPVRAMMAKHCETSYEIERNDISLGGELRPWLYAGTYKQRTNVRACYGDYFYDPH